MTKPWISYSPEPGDDVNDKNDENDDNGDKNDEAYANIDHPLNPYCEHITEIRQRPLTSPYQVYTDLKALLIGFLAYLSINNDGKTIVHDQLSTWRPAPRH